jgi:hypothetical protein
MNEQMWRGELVRAGVPEHLRDGLALYLAHGVMPGDFLSAVLVNDLAEAVSRSDEDSFQALSPLMRFLFNHAPAASWGSLDKVSVWVKNCGTTYAAR